MKIFSASGDVTGKKSPGRPSLHALTDYEELFVISMVLENPRVEQHEICEAVLETTGTEVSISTICRVLRKYGMTRKKNTVRCYTKKFALKKSIYGTCIGGCRILK